MGDHPSSEIFEIWESGREKGPERKTVWHLTFPSLLLGCSFPCHIMLSTTVSQYSTPYEPTGFFGGRSKFCSEGPGFLDLAFTDHT